jgi:hypothetical protein
VVPPALITQNRQLHERFRVVAVLCMLLAVLTIAGWVLYILNGRTLRTANDSLSRARQQATALEGEVQRQKDALALAEARRVDLDGTAESRLAAAERAGKDAEQKRDTAERARKDAEEKRDAAERGRADAEGRLKLVEQARLDAEAKLTAADRARLEAESKATEAQRFVASLQEDAKRLQSEVHAYRQDAQAAVESERKAAQKLQDALVSKIMSDRGTTLAGAAASRPGVAEASTFPGAVRTVPPVAKAAEPTGWPEPVNQPERPEGVPVVQRAGQDPPVPAPASQPGPPDSLLEGAKPLELLRWGEAMIVGAHPDRAVDQKSLGWALLWAGQPAEAKAALEAALVGFEDWPAASSKATPDHWTAAFFLSRVKAEDYIRRWARDEKFGNRLACLPWFYIGQRREMEGHRDEALNAYRLCVDIGQAPNSHPIWRWAQQRLEELKASAGPSDAGSAEATPVASRPAP